MTHGQFLLSLRASPRRRRPFLLLLAAFVPLAIVFALHVPAGAADSLDRYFEGLRQRRLFNLTAGYCLERLQQPNLKPTEKVRWTLELSRTFTEHARYTAGAEQAEYWQRAKLAIDELVAAQPQLPDRPLLEMQRAMVSVAEAEMARWQWDLFPYGEEYRLQAQRALDEALPRLKTLESQLADESRTARRPQESVLSPYELRALVFHARLQIGKALLEQARLLALSDPNRAAALLEGERWLQPLAGRPREDDFTWHARLLAAEVHRLRGDAKQAAGLLVAIEQDVPPRDILDRVVAEKANLLLDANSPADAAQLLLQYRTQRAELPGELLYLNVRSTLALWDVARKAQDQPLAAELLEQAEAHALRAEQNVGGYWAYRTRTLVDLYKESARYGRALVEHMRRARARYGAGRIDEALQEFQQATLLAEQSEQTDLAVDLAYTTGSIQLQSGQLQAAAATFENLANKHPQHERAAAAHLLKAYCLGRLYDGDRTRLNREAYTQALLAHRERFSHDVTFNDATWMLAQLEERRLQITQALKLYLEILPAHDRGRDAQGAAARCYEAILERLRELNQDPSAWEADAIRRLSSFVETFPRSPKDLALPQAEVAIRLARMLLNRKPPDYSQASRLLQHASDAWQQQAADPELAAAFDAAAWKPWQRIATQMQIVSLAGSGSFSGAEALVGGLSDSDPAEVMSILDGLMQLAANTSVETQSRLGEVQLQAALRLEGRREEMSAEQLVQLDRCLAQAYESTGRWKDAVEAYEKLLAAAPRNRKLLETVARLLGESNHPTAVSKARDAWKTIESLEKPGSEAWLAARYHVARCHYELGEIDASRKLIGVTRLVYPALGNAELKRQFDDLQARLAKPR